MVTNIGIHFFDLLLWLFGDVQKNEVHLNEQNKILVAHLYYSDTEYLPLATTSLVIGGVQYYGVLKNSQGFSQKWNITGNNNVTINSPTLKWCVNSSTLIAVVVDPARILACLQTVLLPLFRTQLSPGA